MKELYRLFLRRFLEPELSLYREMGQASSTKPHDQFECVGIPTEDGRRIRKSTMDVPEEAVQAGSIRLNLLSPPPGQTYPNQLVDWTDIDSVPLHDPSQLFSLESVPIWDSLLRLTRSRIGQVPHQLPPIYAYCKAHQDSLVVRVFLTPWGGRFHPLKSALWRDLEKVLMKLVDRWEYEGNEMVDAETLIFENKVF
jgi:hypothetical protein